MSTTLLDTRNAPRGEGGRSKSGRSKGGRSRAGTPKGRQVDPGASERVGALMQERFGRLPARDELIEACHAIQDATGCLAAPDLRALADHMRLSMAEVFEVATFYHHFDVAKEGEAPPAPVTIRVCDGISCMVEGAEALIGTLEADVPEGARVLRASCMGRCASAPAARVGDREVDGATPGALRELAATGATAARAVPSRDVSPYAAARAALPPVIPGHVRLRAYREAGGYALLARVRAGEIAPDAMIGTLSDAGLRGLGGAGFPLGRKWGIVRAQPGPRYLTVNGDEGEPGTFKDRWHLESDPHRFLEGMLVAAHAVGAERCYVYMRDEYPAVLAILRAEIAALEAAGLAAPGLIELRRGAGAYICGEESAMLESIEGRRGYPRHRPPYIAEVGLFGRPTLNHNVETLWWVRDILERGAEWFSAQGKPADGDGPGHPGPRSYSVSGRVRRPGVIRAPAGSTARELIALAGGMAEGHEFAAYLPGGASGGLLPARLGDIPLDFGDDLFRHGAFVGSHALVVFSRADDMREVVLNLMRFFRNESCGQCTPCRNGTGAMVRLIEAPEPDETAIADLETLMRDASICGLGQAAPNPVRHWLDHFRS